MKTNININSIVSNKLHEAFPQFPVSIQESPEGPNTLWVCVFAVPVDLVRSVKNFIHGIQSELLAESDVLLLPMVKNIEVTRQFYPEHLIEPVLSFMQIAERFLLKTVLENKWQSAPLFPALGAVEHHTSSIGLGSDFRNTMTGKMQPSRIGEVRVAANSELALAA